ncbi:MAG: hypothetical protein R2744_12040 [Bacteroidales bacterium]
MVHPLSLFELIRRLPGTGTKVVITTDHGSVRVNNPVKVIGDRHTSANLRYKHGKNLDYNGREVLEIKATKPGAPAKIEHHLGIYLRKVIRLPGIPQPLTIS